MLKIRFGSRPSRPPTSSMSWGAWGLTEDIWSLMQDCWKEVPEELPTVEVTIQRLIPSLPMDTRPIGGRDDISPARFRDSIGGRSDFPSIGDLENILFSSDPNSPNAAASHSSYTDD